MVRAVFRPAVSLSSLSRRPLLATAVAVAGGVAACAGSGAKPVPVDHPVFPMGLALSPDGSRLLVGSSNFDFSFDSGAVLLANVSIVRDELLAGDDSGAVVADPYVSSVLVPEFADRLVFDAAGNSALFTTRDGNLLHEVDVDGDEVSCGELALCNASPNVLQLSGNDPFDVLVLSDDGVTLRGLVSHLGSPQAELFVLDRSSTDAGRLVLEAGEIDFLRDNINSTGVRSTVERRAKNGVAATIFAAVERRENGTLVGADVVHFATPAAGHAGTETFVRQDITTLLGPRSVRDMAIVADDVSGGDALVVLLQNPDGVARFAIDNVDDHLTLTALENTCIQPLSLAVAPLDLDGDAVVDVTRLIVACHGSNEVVALDPLTLRTTAVSRFFGRGPYDVVVDAAHQVAWVSFFLDNSVGAFSLVKDGVPRLAPIGRLGAALPRPEDGRE